MFAEERPALLPLPVEPFRYYQYGERTVHLDGCVEVEAAYYGAPPGWIGRRVQVQWDSRQVRLLEPADRPVAARTPAPGARRPSHQRGGPLPSRRRSARSNCCAAPTRPDRRSARSAAACTRHGRDCGAPHSGRPVAGQEVRRRAAWTTPAPPPSKSASAITASCAAIWSGIHNCR